MSSLCLLTFSSKMAFSYLITSLSVLKFFIISLVSSNYFIELSAFSRRALSLAIYFSISAILSFLKFISSLSFCMAFFLSASNRCWSWSLLVLATYDISYIYRSWSALSSFIFFPWSIISFLNLSSPY